MTEQLETVTSHEHRWSVTPELGAWLGDVLAPSAATPEALPGAEEIKSNRVRTVVRVEPGGGVPGALFVKRFRVRRLGDRLLSLVRASAARREWEAFRRLRRRGVLCPEPVVLGEQRRLGLLHGSVLATREVAGCQEVVGYLDRTREREDHAGPRQALAEALARAAWAIFQAGLDHPDMHLGNFLLPSQDATPETELVVLDLHSARLKSGVPGPARRRLRLGKLAHSFGPQIQAVAGLASQEVRWFAAAYARLDPALGPGPTLAEELVAAALSLERVRLKSRDRRCLVPSTLFAVEGWPWRRVYRRRELPAAALETALEAPALAVVHAHPKGRSRVETIETPPGLAGAGVQLIRKLYLYPHLRARLAGLRGGLALRAWRAARACEVREIPAARHYALVAQGLLPYRATVLMERVEDATMVHLLLGGEGDQEPPPPPAQRQGLARTLGRIMGRFHGQGLKSRDLAVQNILVRRARPEENDGQGEGEGWTVRLVDLDEIKDAAMSRRERLRALTQLADLPPGASRTDRLRFFRAYLAAGGDRVLAAELGEWGERGLGQRVGELLRERAEQKARRLAKRPPRPKPTDVSALRSG